MKRVILTAGFLLTLMIRYFLHQRKMRVSPILIYTTTLFPLSISGENPCIG